VNRRGLLAGFLSLVYPGLGHVYLRSWLRALGWFALSLATAGVLMPPELVTAFQEQGVSAFSTVDIPIELTAALLAVRAFNIADAYLVAIQQARVRSMSTAERKAGGTGEAVESDPDVCPNCGRELDDDLDFCPWCTEELNG